MNFEKFMLSFELLTLLPDEQAMQTVRAVIGYLQDSIQPKDLNGKQEIIFNAIVSKWED